MAIVRYQPGNAISQLQQAEIVTEVFTQPGGKNTMKMISREVCHVREFAQFDGSLEIPVDVLKGAMHPLCVFHSIA